MDPFCPPASLASLIRTKCQRALQRRKSGMKRADVKYIRFELAVGRSLIVIVERPTATGALMYVDTGSQAGLIT
jgi:hypothetical protein